jgi:hypothetical protein
LASAFTPLGLTANATGNTVSIPNAGFEDGTLTGWSRGSQTGTLGASINGQGTGVTVFSGSRLFSHGANGAMGSPTLSNGSENPYYAPAVAAGNWTFSPKNATYAALLQPKGEQTFTQATAALGLSGTQTSQITTMLSSQAQASGFGGGNPTDAAWITREVELTAGVTYTMAWNYMATDYVPFNDGSITSLVPVTVASTPVITVNNFEQSYALLGFSNPGTGDYSTNSYGSTGWQMSTYEVSVTGTYKLGFTVFNLDDTALSPVLMVDSELGTTLSCDQSGNSCEPFGGVEPNNETAPTLPPTTTTTTTTVTPYLNAATDLTATSNADGSVDLDWDAPTPSNVDIYAYGVTFYGLDEIGGTTSGGWGVWTNQGTNYSLSASMFSGTTGFGPVRFGVKAGNQSCFSNEGVGPCVYGPEITVDATVLDPNPSTTTTSSTTTTTTSSTTTTVAPPVETIPTENTTVSIPETEAPISPTTTTILIETIFDTPVEVTPVETPPSESYPEGDGPAASVPQYAPEQETTTQTDEPPLVVPTETQDAADAAVADIFDGPMSNAGLADAVDDLVADAETPEALTAVVNSLLDQELTDTQFSTVIDSVFDGPMSDENFSAAVDAVFADTSTLSDEQFDTAVQAVFDGPLSTEQFGDALEAVFSEPLSDEKFDAIIDAVLDEPLSDEQFAEVVGILESDAVSEEQVAAAVDSILENEVTAEQATDLATSEKVLESIDADQAAEIFDAVAVDELTSAEEAALVAAVTDAPDEVKNAFEETIDIFAEGLDEYVALGSQVDVGTRRSLIAASAAVSTLTAAGAAGAASGGSSGPSSGGNGGGNGGNGNGNGNTEGRTKKEEEGEQEASGEIAGPEEDEDKKPFTRNSIFKYQEN